VANTKRAKSKSGRRRSAASAPRTSRKAVDLALIREEIKNQVGNAASGMVASGIEEANKGHYAAMKFLFELAGLYPTVEGSEESAPEDGLARTLFRRLGVAEEQLTGEVTNDAEGTPGSEANAVE
jgi:hypothetical protein